MRSHVQLRKVPNEIHTLVSPSPGPPALPLLLSPRFLLPRPGLPYALAQGVQSVAMSASADNPLSANVVVRPGALAEVMVGLAAGLGMFLAALDIALNVALPSIRSGLRQRLPDGPVDHRRVHRHAGGAGADGGQLGRPAGPAAGLPVRGRHLPRVDGLHRPVRPTWVCWWGSGCFKPWAPGACTPCPPAIAASLFPESRRGLGMGLTSASQATGMLAGTLGAGLLVRWFDWEAVFLGRIPFTVLALALGVWWMGRGQRAPGEGEQAGKQSFDLVGAATLFGALTCLVIGLRLARSTGWVSPGPVTLMALAPLLLAGFWWTEGRVSWAILPRELLRIRGFLVSGGATFLAHLGVFVIWFIFPFYVEDGLGRGPAALGAMLAVMAGLNIGFSITGGWLCDRTGPMVVGVTGLIVLAAGLFVMGFPGRPIDRGGGCGQHCLGGRRDGAVPVVGLLLDDGQRPAGAVRNGGGGAVAGPSLWHGAVGGGHRRPVRSQKRLPLGRLGRRGV